jgi:hypothetical protein
VRWCTTLLGKKSSVDPLLRLLQSRSKSIHSLHSSCRVIELKQGKTSRWCLAWSPFDSICLLVPGWRFIEKEDNGIQEFNKAESIDPKKRQRTDIEEEEEEEDSKHKKVDKSLLNGGYISNDNKRRNMRLFVAEIVQCHVLQEEVSRQTEVGNNTFLSGVFIKDHPPLTHHTRIIGIAHLFLTPSMADIFAIQEMLENPLLQGHGSHHSQSFLEIRDRIEKVFLQQGDELQTDGTTLVLLTKKLNSNINIHISSIPVIFAWNVCAVLLGKNNKNTTKEQLYEDDDTVIFTCEIQLAPFTNKSCALVSCSLLTLDDSQNSRLAFERFCDRLRRDVVRDGRIWRRRGASSVPFIK